MKICKDSEGARKCGLSGVKRAFCHALAESQNFESRLHQIKICVACWLPIHKWRRFRSQKSALPSTLGGHKLSKTGHHLAPRYQMGWISIEKLRHYGSYGNVLPRLLHINGFWIWPIGPPDGWDECCPLGRRGLWGCWLQPKTSTETWRKKLKLPGWHKTSRPIRGDDLNDFSKFQETISKFEASKEIYSSTNPSPTSCLALWISKHVFRWTKD